MSSGVIDERESDGSPVELLDEDNELNSDDIDIFPDRSLPLSQSQADPCNIHFDPSLYSRPEAIAPLYEGSSVTVLEAVTQHFDWFTSHPGTSKQALSDILHMQHHLILPAGNLLPDSYDSALKMIEPFLIQPITFHACRNDCILFRNEHACSVSCPKCDAPRYKYGSVPAKRFLYLPIRPRLERISGTSKLSQIVQAHGLLSDSENILDIQDAPVWKQAFKPDGIFKGDPRGIGLSLCTDGVNPFSHQRVTYSMWPIMMTILNLPRHVRNCFSNILLLGIIPGSGRKEAQSLSPYLELIVDELLSLADITLFDAYKGAPFKVKVELMLYILDYPGVCKIFNVSGSGAYKGCMWCDIKGVCTSITHASCIA